LKKKTDRTRAGGSSKSTGSGGEKKKKTCEEGAYHLGEKRKGKGNAEHEPRKKKGTWFRASKREIRSHILARRGDDTWLMGERRLKVLITSAGHKKPGKKTDLLKGKRERASGAVR